MPVELLIMRVRTLAGYYPDAFEKALATVPDVPGAEQVASRTLPELRRHCTRLLKQL
jgi:hypothetical protein